MTLRIVAAQPDPAILSLPWSTPLEEWTDDLVVPLPRGLSRHVVRIIQLRDRIYAVKETQEPLAFREYGTLRDLVRLRLPCVVPQGVVAGRTAPSGEDLPAALITQYLRYSLPYRSLLAHGMATEELRALIDAVAVLLVRLHLAGFYWGDVSLSNVLFRRSAGEMVAYIVDAETGELHDHVSDGMRDHDLTLGYENVFAELLDLQASGARGIQHLDPIEVASWLRERYDALWKQLTGADVFGADEMWRIEQRVERLNDMGFDVQELEILTDTDRDTVRVQPRVVELGHHRQELQSLTGMNVQNNQARRMLNSIAAYAVRSDLAGEDRQIVAHRWLTDVYEPVIALMPQSLRNDTDPAEFFHDVLLHRQQILRRSGDDVDLVAAARDYVANLEHAEDPAG